MSRYLEIINICYGLCEQRRWAKYAGQVTVFYIKNELLKLAKEEFIIRNHTSRKIEKAKRKAILDKFQV